MRIFALIVLLFGCLEIKAQQWGSFAGKFYGDGSSLTNLSIGGGAGIPTLGGSGTNTTLYFRYASWGTNNSNLSTTVDTAILSGRGNSIPGACDNTVIVGGLSNTVNASATVNSFIGGGISNVVTGTAGVLVGGSLNAMSGQYGALAGGLGNQIQGSGTEGAIGGGTLNLVNAIAATIPGGQSNTATANFTFAAGYRAKAINAGAFVWADSTDTTKASAAVDSFNVFASGGINLLTSAVTGNGLGITNVQTSGVTTWSATTGNITIPASVTIFIPLNNCASNCIAFTSDASGGTRSLTSSLTKWQNMRVVSSTDPGASKCTITFMTNGVASNITCGPSGGTTASDLTHTEVTVGGVEAGWRIVIASGATSAKYVISIEGVRLL